ncbi:MAG: HD-GYP domain-containing protein [Lachnospiraceae bacterium]|nr:HD-GYP domain-containing protein [Lachnospiraceae bacterium]
MLNLILAQAILVAVMEKFSDTSLGYTDIVTALCILEYYIFLTNVYRQELNDKLDKYVEDIEEAGIKHKALMVEVMEALASAIDAKDEYTHGHSSRVAEYSRKLAEMSGKSEQECDEIYYAAMLHDVGKIGVSDSIITKEGKLTKEEYEEIKKHPGYGKQILERISEFPYLSIGAAWHHERYDGKGYPDGLKGTDIPEIARIISVADAYDAMSSKRSYRDPIPQQIVREELVKGAGTQFDPEYARLMLHLIDVDTEYEMCEREEVIELAGRDELSIAEYRSKISAGILITPTMTTLRMRIGTIDKEKDKIPIPSLILFDSLDGRVHDTEKKKKDLNYFEYGEIWFDGRTQCRGARKIETEITDKTSGDIRRKDEYVIEAVKYRDHMLVRIIGLEQTVRVIIALPDSTRYTYIGLTGEYCRFSHVSIDKAEEDIGEGFIPRIAEAISYINVPAGDLPNVQIDGYRTDSSEGVEVKDGLKISFHSKCLPTARLVWHCPFVDIFTSDDGKVNGANYRDLAFSRFDGEAWECDPNSSLKLSVKTLDSFEGWDAWKEFLREGFDAVVRFKVEENTITIITENCGISIRNKVTITGIDKKIYAAITGDQIAITNIRLS